MWFEKYFKLIDENIENKKKKNKEVFFECHHILPRCLFPEFTKEKLNFVYVKLHIHYEMHKALAKATRLPSLVFAFKFMKDLRGIKDDPDYDEFKEMMAEHQSIAAKELGLFSNSVFQKIQNTKRWDDPEQHLSQNDFMKQNNPMNNPEYRKKISLKRKGQKLPKLAGENNPMKRKEIADKFRGEGNANYVGKVYDKLKDCYYVTKQEFDSHMMKENDTYTGYFCGKLYSKLRGKHVTIKRSEKQIFENLILRYTFIQKETENVI